MFNSTGACRSPWLAGVLAAVAACTPGPNDINDTKEARTEALVQLGQTLFFEPALSEKETVSCASCHDPMHAFADSRQFSFGQNGNVMRRNTPTVINRQAIGFQFWDGRAVSLLDQVAHPLETREEMGYSVAQICLRLDTMPRYRTLFEMAFGSRQVSPRRLTLAISAYIQTLQWYQSDYERGVTLGSTPLEVVRGQQLFFGKGRCSACHAGRNFTDERFHNTGVAWKSQRNDNGRGALTGRDEDVRAFKTPTLRELVRTAPYMHDGSLNTLEEVLDHYLGGGVQADPNLDPAIEPLDLTRQERTDLLAFLRALSDSRGAPFFRRQD